MAIKSINATSPSIKRPFRLSDLQDVWQGLNEALAADTATLPRIVSGFNYTNNPTDFLSAGMIAFKGQLYVMAANVAQLGQTIYGEIDTSDTRTFANGGSFVFATRYLITTTPSPTATLIGPLTISNIIAWRRSAAPVGTPARSIAGYRYAIFDVHISTDSDGTTFQPAVLTLVTNPFNVSIATGPTAVTNLDPNLTHILQTIVVTDNETAQPVSGVPVLSNVQLMGVVPTGGSITDGQRGDNAFVRTAITWDGNPQFLLRVNRNNDPSGGPYRPNTTYQVRYELLYQ